MSFFKFLFLSCRNRVFRIYAILNWVLLGGMCGNAQFMELGFVGFVTVERVVMLAFFIMRFLGGF